jgi:AraC-like DNA-binding protein
LQTVQIRRNGLSTKYKLTGKTQQSVMMKLYIKNMISERCKVLVLEELAQLGIHDANVRIGCVELQEKMTMQQYDQLRNNLQKVGLTIVEDKKGILVQRIKNAILQMIYTNEETPKTKYSNYLSATLNHDYTYMANVFSQYEGLTIEQYIIANRIERVKEMILSDELTLTEIAYRLKYSSVAHLSNQFKKITGFSPSLFKTRHSAPQQEFAFRVQ